MENKQQGHDFDYLLVLDFEATCDDQVKLNCQEIIEFPVVIIDLSQNKIMEKCFHQYIRPVVNPKLTEFCTNLTGIQQKTVDDGIILEEAIPRLTTFLEGLGVF